MRSGKRVVLDTSTLISAVLKPQSTPAQALACAHALFDVVVSADTLDELRKVLQRDYLDRYRTPAQRDVFFREYQAMAIEVDITQTVVACRDPKDDKFLSLALSGGAALIVSSDQDLLSMGQHDGVPILSARAFVDLCE